MDEKARQNVKESFAADMAEHQRMTGQMPTPPENARLAVPLLEQLEQKLEDRDRRAIPDAAAPDARLPEDDPARMAAIRAEAERRGRPGAADRLSIRRLPDKDPAEVLATPRDVEHADRMWTRVRLLLSKRERGPLGQPSWRERVEAILFMRTVARTSRAERAQALVELLDQSEATFGAWDRPADEGRPLIFT